LLKAASRSPCGSVDRNIQYGDVFMLDVRRSPCGSVDRNRFNPLWEEDEATSLPVRERGSKRRCPGGRRPAARRSPCGSVDRNFRVRVRGHGDALVEAHRALDHLDLTLTDRAWLAAERFT